MRRIELYNATQSTADTIRWCREKQLLIAQAACPECGATMKDTSDKCQDGRIWRCSKVVEGTRHFRTVSIRDGSFFSASHLSIRDTLYLIYEWAQLISVHDACYELKIDKKTVMKFYGRCRELCSMIISSRLQGRIGGLDEIVEVEVEVEVEVDECQLGRRKHHRGRIPREIWVCGGVVRDSDSNPLRCFIEIITRRNSRNSRTLEELLLRRIDMRSRVITDGWGAYENLRGVGFTHDVVNHSENFVNPTDSSIHTQNVENLWRCLRRFLNKKGTYTRRNLSEYINEFIFRKAFCDIFEHLLSGIAEIYRTARNN
jgi:ISXO2-like transposase domain